MRSMTAHPAWDMNNTAIIILAAGRSARLGSIKQLLHFNQKTLLQHTIDEAVRSGGTPILVITGAHAETVSASIHQNDIEIVFNPEWEQGKGSGIVAGVRNIITAYNAVDQIIIAVCDQPFVSAALFARLYQTQQDSAKNIVAAAYAGTIGTPVLFTRKYFSHLLGLKNEEGAKKILTTNADDIATVDFPEGSIDIDTKEDFENLLKGLSH